MKVIGQKQKLTICAKKHLTDVTRLLCHYRFTTYQDARRVRLVDGLEYLKYYINI